MSRTDAIPVELTTERLFLRPFALEDADDVCAYASDPEWALYLLLRMPAPYVRRHAEEFIASRLLAPWRTNPTFAIVLDTTVIGGINLRIDEAEETAALGYAIARAHWGKGLAPGGGESGDRLGLHAARAVEGLRHRGPAEPEVVAGYGEARHDTRSGAA